MKTSKPQLPDDHDCDLAPESDLEYRASEDDAWYNVSLVLDAIAETLTVKYYCSPGGYEVVFSAADFQTEAQLVELTGRFRPVSQQCQDNRCGEVAIGSKVCAAHSVGDHDLRFYDAIVEAVDHQPHSFVDCEEQCLCTFVLFWQHGRARGTLTSSSIGDICNIVPAHEVDHRLSAFATLAKDKIASKSSPDYIILGSESESSSSCKGNKSLHIGQSSETQQKGVLGIDIGMVTKSPTWESGGEYCHVILVNNLAKNLTPSSIKEFIYKHTGIMPQAFVLPRMPTDPFAGGAIMVDCPKKVQIIYEFLENPNHIIVSSGDRPWVVVEKQMGRALQTSWSLNATTSAESKGERTAEELEIVHSGMDGYRRAKQLKDLCLEYIRHNAQLCKKLVLEEKKIWQSSQQA